MRVKVLSDLHLEFGPIDPGSGEVLILAGDICTVNELAQQDSELHLMYLAFFEACVANYDKVFYTLGNHEHYNYDFARTEEELKYWLKYYNLDISVLNNEHEEYKGWVFYGSTMWTNFKNMNFTEMERCEVGMNDYRIVTNGDKLLRPIDTFAVHKYAVERMERVIPTLGDNVFVFTHHAPSFESMTDAYRSDDVKGAYATDMNEFIQNNPNIKYWAHGHVHETNNYTVGECNVISNPRGYYQHGENPDFNIEFNLNLMEVSK